MKDAESTQSGTEQTQTAENADQTISELSAQIKALRSESASYRTRAKTLEAELAKHQPTLDESAARIAKLEADLQTVRESALNASISAVASQLNFHSPQIVASIVNRDGLTADNVQEITKRLSEIAKQNTWMLRTVRTDAGAVSESSSDPTDAANAWIRQRAQGKR